MADEELRDTTGRTPPEEVVELTTKQLSEEAARLQGDIDAVRHTVNENALDERLYHTPPITPIHAADYVPNLGNYIVPQENTLINHHHLVLNRSNELSFGEAFSPLDDVAGGIFKDSALSRPNHPNYFDYEPLRDNIAIVRNYVMHVMASQANLDDTETNKATVDKLDAMGWEIAQALNRGSKIISMPGLSRLDPVEASQPGSGAAKIYELLVQQQNKITPLTMLKSLVGKDYSTWNLPSVQHSPFNKANVVAFKNRPMLPSGELIRTEGEGAEHAYDFQPVMLPPPETLQEAAPAAQPIVSPVAEYAPAEGMSAPQQIAVLGSTLAGTAISLERVHRLPKPVREEAIQIARDILDKLRFTLGDAAPRDEWMMRPTEEVIEESHSFVSVAGLYADVFNNARTLDPRAAEDLTLQQSNEALGKLAYLVKEQGVHMLEEQGRLVDAELLRAEMAIYPDSWKQVDGMKMGELVERLKAGLDRGQEIVEEALRNGVELAPVNAQKDDQPPHMNPAVLAASLSNSAQVLRDQQRAQQPPRAPLSPQPVNVAPVQVPRGLSGVPGKDLQAVRQISSASGIRAGIPPEMARPSHADKVGQRPAPDFGAVQQTPITPKPAVDRASDLRLQEAKVIR